MCCDDCWVDILCCAWVVRASPRCMSSPPSLAVQASIAANTYVVSGPSQVKKLQDLLPGILSQLGPDNLASLKKIAQAYEKDKKPEAAGDDDDDDVPDLVENFEEASKK